MSSNATDARLNITAISVSAETGMALRNVSEAGGYITIHMPHLRPFDGSQVRIAARHSGSHASALRSTCRFSGHSIAASHRGEWMSRCDLCFLRCAHY